MENLNTQGADFIGTHSQVQVLQSYPPSPRRNFAYFAPFRHLEKLPPPPSRLPHQTFIPPSPMDNIPLLTNNFHNKTSFLDVVIAPVPFLF